MEGREREIDWLLCLSVACLIGQVCFLNCFKLQHKSKQKAHRETETETAKEQDQTKPWQ